MIHAFADFELDAAAFELRRGGVAVEVQPKVFDLLRFFVENPGRVVKKQELLDAVWPDEHVSESALAFCLTHVRKALGQAKGDNAPLETVHRRGYRFTGEVRDLGAPLTPPRLPSLAPPSPSSVPDPFVGRSEPLGALRARLDAALSGHGALVLVSGEAGTGKTRLARELGGMAGEQGATVWVGRALDDEAAPVLWPWIAALRQGAEDAALGAATRERLRALLEELLASPQQEPREPTRFWVQARVAELLREVARTVPLVLVLEDMQWADELSCKLCRTLARELGELRVLVLLTVRSAQARSRALDKLREEAPVHALQRLSVDDVAQYLERATGTRLDPAVVEALWAVTGGLPLALHEALRLLSARHGAAALGRLSPGEIRLLETAGAVLQARLKQLSEPTRALLGVASVLGTRFEQATLERMLGEEAATMLTRLDEAVVQRLLAVTSTPGVYAFAHALLRDAVYEHLSVTDKVRWHAAAATALEPHALDAPRLQELVGHLRRAAPGGDTSRAKLSALSERAARAAQKLGGHADAARFYGWAYEAESALAQPDLRRRAELLVEKGRAELLSGQAGEGRRTFKQAVELAEREQFADLLVRVGQQLRPTFMWAGLRDDLARRALEAALACAPAEAQALRGLALAALSCTPPHSLGPDHGKDLSEQALALARRSGDGNAQREALRARLATLTGPDDIAALLSAADELLALEAANTRSWPVAEAHQARMLAFMHAGELQRADSALDAFGRAVERLGLAEPLFNYERMRLQRRLQQGHYAEVRRGYEALWAAAERMELRYAAFFRGMAEAELVWDLQGGQALTQNAALFEPLGQWSGINDFHRALWTDVACTGDRAELGRPAFAELVARLDGLVRDAQYLSALSHLSSAAIALGDHAAAAALYERLAPYAKLNTTSLYMSTRGSVEHFLGELSAFLGERARAATHLTHALSRNTQMGLAICTVRTKLALARLWRTDRDTRARAQRLLAEARAEAGALGTHALDVDT